MDKLTKDDLIAARDELASEEVSLDIDIETRAAYETGAAAVQAVIEESGGMISQNDLIGLFTTGMFVAARAARMQMEAVG